jgi:hypothetical protein
MNTQKITAGFRISKWGGLVRERIASGQSISAFCEENGICVSTYYYRQRMVREAASMGMLPADVPANAKSLKDPAAPQNTIAPAGWFKACGPESVYETASPDSLTVSISGCRISFTENTDTALFLKAVRALGGCHDAFQ